MGTASWVEIVWTAITGIGACASAYNLVSAIGDLSFASHRLAETDDRRQYAHASVRREVGYFIALVVFAFIGFQSLASPEPPPAQISPTLRMVYIGMFVLAATALSANSILDARQRKRERSNGS